MSVQSSENNKRIAKNTLVLYVRMLFSMAVSFYTSRVILDVLGVEDFGINNVVGGVAGMFSFLNSSFAGATSRFLTYDIGVGNEEKLSETFKTALTIHLALAIIVFLLCETVGLWLLERHLVIPPERMFAARVVFQLSVLSCMLSITQVPYNAALIAHERMDVFALFGIANVCLKLLIVFMLTWFGFDKLILYGVLFFLLSFGTMMAYRVYGNTHYAECRFRFTRDWKNLKPMLTFSGWDMYGNMSVMLKDQGVNILQNMFWGPAVNAATGIANQVNSAVTGFSYNFMTAIEPQIVKLYAQGEYGEMQKLAIRSSRFSFFLLFLISFPAMLKVGNVLDVWLVEVPDYVCVFFQLAVVYNWFNAMMNPMRIIIHATGRMKLISFVSGSIFLLSVPVSYLFLKFGCNPTTPFVINIFIIILVLANNIAIVKRYIPSFSVTAYICGGVLHPLATAAVGAIAPVIVCVMMDDGWAAFFCVCALCVMTEALAMFFLGMNPGERKTVITFVGGKLHRG